MIGPCPKYPPQGEDICRLNQFADLYPEDGQFFTIDGELPDHTRQQIERAVQRWTGQIHPYLQATFAMDTKPMQPYQIKETTLKQAMRISDEPLRTPRARMALARYLQQLAIHTIKGLPPPRVTGKEHKRITKQLGETAAVWWEVVARLRPIVAVHHSIIMRWN